MTTWITSDTHFSHKNILTFSHADRRTCSAGELQCDEACKSSHPRLLDRPNFASLEEMDELLVKRWNEVVRPQDHIYHIGDVCMNKRALPILLRLHGHKRLVGGNHDIFPLEYGKYFEKLFGCRKLDGMILTHFPIHPSCLKRFRANIHGHTHNRSLPPPYINVSVEVRDYRPISLEELSNLATGFETLGLHKAEPGHGH